jgi:hypothetical protein
MSDVLIRDVPDDVLAVVEAHAARLGLLATSTSAGSSPRTPRARRLR